MHANKLNKYSILLIIILIIAFIIRFIGAENPFCGNDKAMFQQFSIDSFPIEGLNSLFKFDNYGMGNPLRVFALLYSIIYPIFWIFILGIYTIIGIPITELSWRLPVILIGLLSLIVIYRFLLLFLKKKESLMITAFFAILPIHVAWSRSLANIMMFSLPIQLGAIYYCIKYFQTNNTKYAFRNSVLSAIFILTDNFFPQFILVMAFTILASNNDMFNSFQKFTALLKKILNWQTLLLPITAGIFQILIYFMGKFISTSDVGANIGMIGHIFAKPKYFDFHLLSLADSFLGVINPVLFIFILLMVTIGIKHLFTLKKESILLFAGLIYSLPFAFFLDPSTVNVKVYIFTSIVFLIMFSFIMLFKLKFKPYFKNIILVILFIVTILHLFPKIYGIPEYDTNFITNGAYLYDCGIKAVGFWVRTNTAPEAKIMSKYESTRIGPINGKYYLHRQIYNVFEPANMNNFFEKHLNEVDYIILGPYDNDYIQKAEKNSFILSYKLLYQNNKTFLVFSKNVTKTSRNFKNVDISKYDAFYTRTFNKLTDYVGAPNYVSDSPAWV